MTDGGGDVRWTIPDDLAAAVADRPRAIVTGSDFDRAVELVGTDDRASGYVQALREEGDRLLEEPPMEYELPDGLRLLGVSRTVRERIETLATLARLDDDDRYADRAALELKAVADFPDWNPNHFLDTAEMATAVAVGYDWLHDRLDPGTRRVLADAVVEHAFEEALPGYREKAAGGTLDRDTDVWWMEVEHNWSTVCNGGLSVAALALAGDDGVDHDLLREILVGARTNVENALETLGPAGGWPEGPMYWAYNARYLVYYLATCEAALGDDLGVVEGSTVDRTGDFPLALTGPGGVFGFCDAHPTDRIDEPALYWLARRFDRPSWAAYQRASASDAGSALDLLFYDPAATGGDWQSSLDGVTRFPAAEDVAVFRGPEETFLGVKGGDNQVNHHDLDLGTFVYDARGVRWARDLGSNDYNLSGYWDGGAEGQRWDYHRRRAAGHNLLVIDPDDGPDQDPFATASLDRVESSDDRALAVTDLGDAYPGTVRRGVALVDGRRHLRVRDEIAVPEPATAYWLLQTDAEVTVDGERAFLENGGERLDVTLRRPLDAAFGARPSGPLPGTPEPPGEERLDGVTTLFVRLEDVEETAIEVQLGGETEIPEATPSLDEWSVDDGF